MANENICSVCKQAYPANLASCPHCAAAGGSGVELGAETLNLGASPDPASGTSKTSWASLVQEQQELADLGGDPVVKFDAKSDADLLKKAQPPQKPAPALPKAFGAGGAPAGAAPSGGKPTMAAPKGAGPTMIAPEAQQPMDIPGQPAGGGGAAKTPGPKATTMSGRVAQPTKVVPQAKPTKVASQPAKTMFAPQGQQPLDMPPDPKATAMSGRVAQPTKVAAQAAPTKVVPPASPTQLAPPEEALLDMPPGSPKATVMSGRQAQETKMAGTPPPTTLAPPKSTQLATPGGLPTKLVPPPQPTQIAPPDQVLPPDDSAESDVDLTPPHTETGTSSGELAKMLLEQPEKPESSAVDLGSAEVVELTAPGQSAQMGLEPPKLEGTEEEGESSAVDLGSHPSLELPPIGESSKPSKVDGEPVAEVNWDNVPATTEPAAEPEVVSVAPADDQAHLSQLGTAPALEEAKDRAKPRYGRRWVAGGILGMVAGAAAILVFWVLGVLQPEWRKQARDMLGMGSDEPASELSLDGAFRSLDNGDAAKAFETLNHVNFPEDEKNDGAYKGAMGEARWLRYLGALKGARPDKTNPEVVNAVGELNGAKNARAVFWLGHIDEATGDVNGARTKYNAGKGTPDRQGQRGQKMCDTALERLDGATAPGGGADRRNGRESEEEQLREALAMLLILQVPPPADDEAGFTFWKAAQAAKKGEYGTAADLLKQARAAHEKSRFSRIRKAQNPTSDPTEEIFLRSADELIAYWSLLAKLKMGGYDSVAAIEKALQDAKGNYEVVQAVADALKLKPDAKKDEFIAKIKDISAGAKPDEQLDNIRKALVDKKIMKEDEKDAHKGVQSLIKDWETQKSGRVDAEGKLGDIAKALKDAGIEADDPAKGIQDLVTKNKNLGDFISGIGKMLVEKKFIEKFDLKDLDELTKGLVALIDKASNPQVLATSLNPKGMLNVWLSVLDLDRGNREMGTMAFNDARRVTTDKTATVGERGKALAVEGLALRNTGQFADAQRQLGQSLKSSSPEVSWYNQARVALRELTDPNAYYVPRTEMYVNYGHPDRAIAVADSGLQVFPNNGPLLAQRSLARLDVALRRGDGNRIQANTPGVAEAVADAQAAVAAGSVIAGNFALGRVAEELGDRAGAERAFRQALSANPPAEQAAKLRVALGRVLLQRRNGPPFPVPAAPVPAPAPAPAPAENGKPAAPAPAEKLGRLELPGENRLAGNIDIAAALAMLLILQVGDGPIDPAVDEIIRLAEQAIRQGNAEGHLIKAQALARKGLHNAAVQEYIRGLQKLVRPEYAEGLRQLIDIHPAFNRPEGRQPPDQFMAERHYGAGLHRYHSGQYREAEREFLQAVGCYDQDARYLYYLGLARLAQGYRTYAVDDFRTAAELEKLNKPGSAAISQSLERVQGPTRVTLNRYRP